MRLRAGVVLTAAIAVIAVSPREDTTFAECIAKMGDLDEVYVKPDENHGVWIRLHGSRDKWIAVSISPDAARDLAHLLEGAAEHREDAVGRVPIDL